MVNEEGTPILDSGFKNTYIYLLIFSTIRDETMNKTIKFISVALTALAVSPILAGQVEINKAAIALNSKAIKSNFESLDYLQDEFLDTPSKIGMPRTPKICKGTRVLHWGTCPLNLTGVRIALKAIYQASASSNPILMTHPSTAEVIEPGVEFPSLASLDIKNDGYSLLDVAINVGIDFVEIDFSRVPAGRFGSGFENTYILELKNVRESLGIKRASIDRSATTLGLEDSDVKFVGNKLFINVGGLSFNSASFVRINLSI